MGSIPTSTMSFHYLSSSWRKGFRNGNWKKLKRVEKALYMASLSLAKTRGRIVNSRLILQLRSIIDKLRETASERLIQIAYQRSMNLYEKFVTIGLFNWAPQVRSWFNDPSYVLYLGLCSLESFPC